MFTKIGLSFDLESCLLAKYFWEKGISIIISIYTNQVPYYKQAICSLSYLLFSINLDPFSQRVGPLIFLQLFQLKIK